MKATPKTVLQLVTHCAGRRVPPAREHHDAMSCRIRIVTAYVLLAAGMLPPSRTSDYAEDRVDDEVIAGGPLLELLLVVVGQLAGIGIHRKPTPETPVAELDETPKAIPPACVPTPAVDSAAEVPPKHTPWKRTIERIAARSAGPQAVPDIPAARDCPRDRSTCDRTSCRHHLAPPARHPCSLALAAEGPMTLDEIGKVLGGITRSRVQQLEARALAKLRAANFDIEDMVERPLTYADRAELAAPGKIGLSYLRTGAESWRGPSR